MATTRFMIQEHCPNAILVTEVTGYGCYLAIQQLPK